ncbi:hypothetical protein [Arthrobacter mobilis]|nr:hypothetical protein [Arthrobacter mobilis]
MATHAAILNQPAPIELFFRLTVDYCGLFRVVHALVLTLVVNSAR